MRRADFLAEQAKALREFDKKEEILDLLGLDDKDVCIHINSLYGISGSVHFWGKFRTLQDAVAKLTEIEAKTGPVEMRRVTDSFLKFTTKDYLDTLSDEEIMKARVDEIMPIKFHLWGDFGDSIHYYRELNGEVIDFKIPMETLAIHRYMKVSRTYNKQTLVRTEFWGEYTYNIWDDKKESIATRAVNRMYESTSPSSNFYATYIKDIENSADFKINFLNNWEV